MNDPGPLPRYQPSPVATVDFLGQSFSIERARIVAQTVLDHVVKILHPADGWKWHDGKLGRHLLMSPEQPTLEQVATTKTGLERAFDEWAASAMGVITTSDPALPKLDESGSGFFFCYFRPALHAPLQECGSTNALDDAKWMVAEAIRTAEQRPC